MENVVAHKAGFISIIGHPNVGKSTLMNALIGEKLSIMNPKAQTTRHRIMGIANGDNYQLVFSDTPGIIKPKYKLQERMMDFVESAYEDADIMLFLTDVEDSFETEETFAKVNKIEVPLILAINKADLTTTQEEIDALMATWKTRLPKAEIFVISALRNFNVQGLFARILELLPENPPYFPKENISDKNVRFFVSEMIREQLLKNYSKEIPYSAEVVIESYKETPTIDHISALIYVERESQKGIIIGPKGESLKRVGTYSRMDMEKFLGKKVFLEIFVKVKKDWRASDSMLKSFGY
jgi:GTP-binding protein Era